MSHQKCETLTVVVWWVCTSLLTCGFQVSTHRFLLIFVDQNSLNHGLHLKEMQWKQLSEKNFIFPASDLISLLMIQIRMVCFCYLGESYSADTLEKGLMTCSLLEEKHKHGGTLDHDCQNASSHSEKNQLYILCYGRKPI